MQPRNPPSDVPRETGNGLLSAAAIIALSGLASRALGLVRDRLLADRFGAGEVLDAYFAAYRIPDLLYNLLVLGALSAAFLPVASHYLSQGDAGRRAAFRLANALMTIAVAVLAVIAAFLSLAAPFLIRALAPGFDEAQHDLTVLFTRIMLLQPILLGLSSVVGGLLLAFHRFLAYAAAPVLYNVGIILGVLLFVPALGPMGLAWGVVIGALLHLCVQVPSLRRTGFRFVPQLGLQHEGLRTVSRLFMPRLVGLMAGQVSDLVVTFLGSVLAAGSIAAYALAENLQAVPVGLAGISMAVAVFPFLASAAARQEVGEFTSALTRAIRLTLFVTLPASVFILLFRAQLVRVILGSGNFDWNDTTMTFGVLGVLAFAVVPQSLIPILARAFFSVHDTRTPMFVSLLAIAINIGGALVLVPVLDVAGLAWAAAASGIVHLALLLALLHSRLGGLDDAHVLRSVGRVGVGTVAAAFVVQGPGRLLDLFGLDPARMSPLGSAFAAGVKGVVAAFVNMQTFAGVTTQLAMSFIVGVLVFAGVTHVLGATELSAVREVLRLPRRRPVS